MSVSQRNFDDAVDQARSAFAKVQEHPDLSKVPRRQLETWIWEISLVSTTIRNYVLERTDDGPVDLG